MVTPELMEPEAAKRRLDEIFKDLPPGTMVTVERDTIEVPPQDGWRRYRAGNMIVVRLYPPRMKGT